MAVLLGGLASLIALLAGMLGHVGPETILQRAAVAFCIGWVSGHAWQLVASVIVNPETEIAGELPGQRIGTSNNRHNSSSH